METVKVGPFGNTEMQAKFNKFHAKNWLYIDFGNKSRVCVDLATGELVKGQCHKAPVIPQEEINRIVAKFQ